MALGLVQLSSPSPLVGTAQGSSYENSRFLPIRKDTSLPPVMGLAGLAAIGKLCFICEHPSLVQQDNGL